MCGVSKYFRITTETNVENEIYVHIGDGAVVTFRELETVLFLMDSYSLAVACTERFSYFIFFRYFSYLKQNVFHTS